MPVTFLFLIIAQNILIASFLNCICLFGPVLKNIAKLGERGAFRKPALASLSLVYSSNQYFI